MVRPGFNVDEDWEILLLDEARDDAWEVDDSQKRSFYVGTCAFEKRDTITKRRTSLRIFSGRIRMPAPPLRFQTEPRVQSPIRWAPPVESDPSEEAGPIEEAVPSESVDSPPGLEHVAESEGEDVVMTEADMERN